MNNSIVLSPKVLSTINALPVSEQKAIFGAFICDNITKTEREITLSPLQEMVYAMISDYIQRDTAKYESSRVG
ncbi:MAG: hypothetical protein R3Y22_04745 [Bacteroidales bacterium]